MPRHSIFIFVLPFSPNPAPRHPTLATSLRDAKTPLQRCVRTHGRTGARADAWTHGQVPWTGAMRRTGGWATQGRPRTDGRMRGQMQRRAPHVKVETSSAWAEIRRIIVVTIVAIVAAPQSFVALGPTDLDPWPT